MNKVFNREEKWHILSEEAKKRGGNGDELVAAMKKLYSVYSEDMLVWLGGLFDAKIGGFYYSASAKNNDGYLPDIESTYQAIVLLQRAGVIDSYDRLPEWVRRRIAGFICSLEDPDNGYFYHPQWSKSLVDAKVSRKGRDLNWAVTLSYWLDFKLPYPNANERLRESLSENSAADLKMFSSEKQIREYIDSLDFKNNRTVSIHRLISQAGQINAAGFSDIILEFFNSILDEKTGIFPKDITISDIYSLYGISSLYRSVFKTMMPGSSRFAEILLSKFLCEGADFPVNNICHIRNAWGFMDNTIFLLREYGNKEDKIYAENLSLRLLRQAPAAISYTTRVISGFKKPTGAFSFSLEGSPKTSQGVPIAPESTVGGDVNATTISVGMINSIFKAMGLSEFMINLFEPESFDKFLCTIS
ncbi:MAG: hypothetical protein J6B48_00155 [Clostridia bacterium]|nr:hypothetical protein [Clostridia bacterium]